MRGSAFILCNFAENRYKHIINYEKIISIPNFNYGSNDYAAQFSVGSKL